MLSNASVKQLAIGFDWVEGPVWFGDANCLLLSDIPNNQIMRTEHDGAITIIADAFNGKPLNSSNDVVVKSDGTIWFPAPHYGIMTNYEGFKSVQGNACVVYRFDPVGDKLT